MVCSLTCRGNVAEAERKKDTKMSESEKLVILAARNYFAQQCDEEPSYHWFNAEIDNTDEALLEHIEAEAHASGHLMTEDTLEDIQMRRLEIVLSVMWNG